MNKETAKAKAKSLRSYLSTLGFDLNYSRALEAVARMEGETCFNTLQSKFVDAPSLTPIADAVAVKASVADGYMAEDLDPHAGLMPAYRKGRLQVTLSYSSTLSRMYLVATLQQVNEYGEPVGAEVSCICRCLSLESFRDVRCQFVCFVAETLADDEYASLSVQEMQPGFEILAHATQDAVEAVQTLRQKVAAKSSGNEDWAIEVCRKEMADVTVIVHNATRTEAENEAIGETSSRDLDAHETDYLLADSDLHADDPKVDTVEGDDGSRASWEISVRRISYGFIAIPIEGRWTKEEAEMMALDEANEHEFFNTSDRHIVKTIKKL